ncbi:thioredoxin domain-containing protein [bacterium AH-315-P15]|nr:thioredoxin domain-containing protein [bacterium AH-315-P15]
MPENRLASETSPYLRQHKDNPVHWWPWGPEALAEAERTGKPVLLSVGYAACHWCHVMAHESFEDEATAKLMNAEFINIKVDREERPDVDRLYMSALQVMQHQGGWPMTMFLTSKGEAFFGGTYFPKDARQGMPAFQDLLKRIAQTYKDQPGVTAGHAGKISEALRQIAAFDSSGTLSLEGLDDAMARIAGAFDVNTGGLRGAPKFPQTLLLEFVWRNALRHRDPGKEGLVTLTLERMSNGGIYDHLGGGFARYAVDSIWMVPHFEKMLYDNALLISMLTKAWQRTVDPLFQARVKETVGWALREMQLSGGGFASSLDADTEGEEGKFYVWTEAEIDAVLGTGEDAALFKAAYAVGPGGNWEGKTILNCLHPQPPVSEENTASLTAAKAKLFQARTARTYPGLDDKVLADWNGLMIAALAEASQAFGHPEWLEAAQSAYRFVVETMSNGERLYHAAHENTARHDGMADDYANMTGAALTLFEVTGQAPYLDKAAQWVKVLDQHFWNQDQGGYSFTSDDAEALVVRSRSVADDATPNANGSMMMHLTRLWLLTGENTYRRRAEELLGVFAAEAANQALGVGSFLAGADFFFTPVQVAILGRRDQAGTQALVQEAFKAPLPNRVLQVIDPGQSLPKGHPAFGKKQDGHQPTAYVCIGTTCSLPVTSAAALAQVLAAPAPSG